MLSAPLLINWALTNRCNFRCRHCYSRTDPFNELSLDELKTAITTVRKAGVFSLNFGGGEPLLRKDLLEVANYAHEAGLSLSMNSNGYLLNRRMALQLKEAGLGKVGISIDSSRPEIHDSFRGVKGSFQRAVRAVEYLKDAGVETSISSVVCRINYREIGDIISMAKTLGVKQLNLHNFKCSGMGFRNMSELDLSPDEWRNFYTTALRFREDTEGLEIGFDDPILCLLGEGNDSSPVKGSVCGKLSLNIKANGDITPCGFIPMVIGNILRDDFITVWEESELLQRMRNKTPRGKCATCSHYNDCLGGCTARAIALHGTPDAPDPHCWRQEDD
ncbi:MAG: GeoRSP system radical SAM/SPASM protein [Nitrospirae bacterium]|nr:MAG: GeoRSP system radical SAM/SPASM protein [Nitrospirota bacterium]